MRGVPIKIGDLKKVADRSLARARTSRLGPASLSTIDRSATFDEEVKRRQLDCHIFFLLVEFGWGRFEARRSRTGKVSKVQVEPSPVSGMRRLGYPDYNVLRRASRLVRAEAPEEAAAYRRARASYLEARRRWEAAKTQKKWVWYACGHGNRRSVAYMTDMERRRRRSYASQAFENLVYKYRYQELLPRLDERRRARREMDEARGDLARLREAIFERLGVPPEWRSL